MKINNNHKSLYYDYLSPQSTYSICDINNKIFLIDFDKDFCIYDIDNDCGKYSGKDLVAIVLDHEHFRSHLDSEKNTIDVEFSRM